MDSQNPETNPAANVSFSAAPGVASMTSAPDADNARAQPTEAPAPRPAKQTMLRRLLSHHEIATLLLLLSSPIDAGAKPEIPSLQEEGLVEQVSSQRGMQKIRLTSEGNAVLKGLGLTGRDDS